MKKNNRNDRDLLIAEISGDNYGRLLDEYTDELGGMIGVSIYIINIVDELIESEEYVKAVIYESDETHGNGRWQYFNEFHGTCLDWYFLDKANKKIEKEFPRLEKNQIMVTLHEAKFIEYKLNVCNLFDKSLYDTFFKGDEDNRKKLISAFPELEVANRFSNERGYWDDLLKRHNEECKKNYVD